MKRYLHFLFVLVMVSTVAHASQQPPPKSLINNYVGDSSTSASASASAGESKLSAPMMVAMVPSAQEACECPDFLETAEGKEARACYEAAFAGDAEEQYNLGTRCEFGRGVVRDNWLAYTWYLKSSLQGNMAAQLSVASCYRYGIGVVADLNYAIERYKAVDTSCQNLAHGLRCAPACCALGELYSICRKRALEHKNASKAHQYRALSLEYYHAAAKGDWGPALVYLGKRDLALGDIRMATHWLQKAAAQGEVDAIATLARLEERQKIDAASNAAQKDDSKEAVKE